MPGQPLPDSFRQKVSGKKLLADSFWQHKGPPRLRRALQSCRAEKRDGNPGGMLKVLACPLRATYGRTGTVDTELYGEPSMILRLTAR